MDFTRLLNDNSMICKGEYFKPRSSRHTAIDQIPGYQDNATK